jgi:hypothetical protein
MLKVRHGNFSYYAINFIIKKCFEVTANAEGDTVVVIAGNVSREDRLKRTHQSMKNATLFSSITKYSKEIVHLNSISEALVNVTACSCVTSIQNVLYILRTLCLPSQPNTFN